MTVVVVCCVRHDCSSRGCTSWQHISLHIRQNSCNNIIASGFPSCYPNNAEQRVYVWHADCNDKPEQWWQTVLGTPHLHICDLLVRVQGEIYMYNIFVHVQHDFVVKTSNMTGELSLQASCVQLFMYHCFTQQMSISWHHRNNSLLQWQFARHEFIW